MTQFETIPALFSTDNQGKAPSFFDAWCIIAVSNCFMLFWHSSRREWCLLVPIAGSKSAARTSRTNIVTATSIHVTPDRL
jgi:hypothetical protein